MRRPALVLLGFLMSLGVTATKGQTPGAASKPATGAPNSSVAPKPIHLPLFFEANRGQADSRVKFMARGKGYTLLLTPTETVLAESQTQVSARSAAFGPFQNPLIATKTSRGTVIRMQLVGANSAPAMTGVEALPGKVNYLIGNDPSKWQTEVPLYSQARSEQVYPGVDLLFHGDERQLEYDFVVAPGADPSKIAFRIRGAARMKINAHGDLVLHGTDSDFVMHKPVIYQTIAAERRPIEGSFVKRGKNEVAFRLGAYDPTQELVIDPAIGFSSFLGGGSADMSGGFAVDDSTPGSPKLYLGGFTLDSTTFPEASTVIGSGTTNTKPVVEEVAFLAKIDPTAAGAASLVYLTFIGGSIPTLANLPGCISAFVWLALDKSQGAANIVPVLGGITDCSNFPSATVLNPVTDPTGTSEGLATVAVRMMPSGKAIDKAVILGGQNNVEGGFVAVGAGGSVILSGETQAHDLPTKNAYVNSFNNGDTTAFDDCYVSILNRADLSISYLTYLNVGGGSTSGTGVGCGAFEDASGNILAGGNTVSATAFNLGPGGTSLANGFQTTFKGTIDTFAIKLNTSLVGVNQLLYATYFGGGGATRAGNGSFDLGNGVVAIVGGTTSNATKGDIPLKNAFQTQNKATGNGAVGFLVLINTLQTGTASLQCGTYFGGSGGDEIVGAVTYDAGDPTDYRIILGGRTNSATDFPTLNPIQPYVGGVVNGVQSPDAFLSILRVPTPNQTAFNATLVFSTYIGGNNPPAQFQSSPGAPPLLLEDDRINAVALDANHTVYAAGESNAPGGFFANTNPTTTVNGFQTTCVSCSNQSPSIPEDDVVVFSIGTGANATLQSIAVTPTTASIAVGQTQQFSAVGNFNDGTEKDITSLVTWTTVPTGFATMSTTSPGLATGTAAGSTAVTPSLGTATVLNTGALTVTGGAAATHFSVTAPGTATAGTAFSITVTALDASNAVVTGYTGTVHFTSGDVQAVLPANSTLTNGTGTFLVTLKTAGDQTIAATDTVTASITGTSGTVTVAGAAGAALTITKSGPATATLNTQAHYMIVITNNGPAAATGVTMNDPIPGPNNPPGLDAAVPGCFISNQIETTIFAVGCSFSTPLAAGASITIPYHVTYMSNGTFTNTATVSGTNNTSTNNTASVTTTVGGATAATHFSVTAPANATSGSAFNVTVTALDASNAVVTGYTGTVHFTSSDLQAVLPANSTLTNGVGTFSATLKTAGAQTIAATDTVTASITGSSGAITVSAAATATHFSVTAPANATAGTAINITVTALTASNATATGYTGTVHFTSSDTQAVLPANSTLTNGVGTFSATLNTVGNQTIGATDTVTASITGGSGNINVSTAATVQLTVQTAGTGTGTVTGNGINCVSGSANACTVSLPAGTQVVLTQAGTNGSTFAGWNGAPTSCTVAGATCTFTMPGSAETVTATFTAAAATLKSIAVTPANPTEPINSSVQFTATGTFSDNSAKDITATVTWASSNTEAATINAAGLVTVGGTAGLTTTISATLNEVTGSTLLTVSSSPIAISVTPPAGGAFPPVPPGGTLAIGIVLTSTPGFTGTVTFGCTTSSPTITCAPDPATVTLTPTGPTDVAIVLNTFCKGTTTGQLAPMPGGFGGGGGFTLLLLSLTLGGVLWMRTRSPRWAVSFAILVLMAIGGASCASPPKGPNGATQPGDYTVTFSATVNGVTTSTAPISFTVE